jgi:hypothetical protein
MERSARHEYKRADPSLRRRIRLNRGVFNIWGQQANMQRACGPQGARSVRTKANGWDGLLSFLTVGIYTPQHAYVVCNPPVAG